MPRYGLTLSILFSILISSAASAATCAAVLAGERLPYPARFDIMINGPSAHELAQVAAGWGFAAQDLATHRERWLAQLRVRGGVDPGELEPRDEWLDALVKISHVLIEENAKGRARPGFTRALIWRRLYGAPRAGAAEVSRDFGVSAAYVRQKAQYLQRRMAAGVRGDVRRLAPREQVYDAFMPLTLPHLARYVIRTDGDHPEVGEALPPALGTWLRARVFRAYGFPAATSTPESYAREERFNTFILALQLGVARAIARLPAAQREWGFRVVTEEVLAEEYDRYRAVQWTPKGVSFTEGRKFSARLRHDVLEETLAALRLF